MIDIWKPCHLHKYLQNWGKIPDDVYIRSGISWQEVLKDYEKSPTLGDLIAIYRICNEEK
jgi:hypothetical protein